MAIQTLVPQYYDYQNSNATIISSSGTFVNYHHYVSDSTNTTYLEVSGDAEKMSFGFGDIILRPKAITVNITASGDKDFYFSTFNENTNRTTKLFTNKDNDSIIATHTNKYCAHSGRFDTYSYNLDLCYSGYNLTDLENSILNINILPSSYGQNLVSRISKIDLVISGDPLYANDINLYIPGDVTNRLIESYPLEAEDGGFADNVYFSNYPIINSSKHILRANFQSSNFNLGHYLFDELSGNTIYSSGVVASGIVKDTTTPWYNYYRNPIGLGNFRQCIDVRNYIDFGNIVPTGDFTIYMRFLASGEARRATSGYGYNDRSLFSAGDISIKCIDNTDDIEINLAGNALQHTTYFSSGVWEDLLVTYKNQLLSYYISDELHAQSYVPNRVNSSGNVIVGGYTSIGFSGGTVPYDIGHPFAISEFGLSSYGFTESQVYDFYGSLGYSRVGYPSYLSESIHPSADTTYVHNKLMNASGEYTVYTRIAPSSFAESVINITSPFVMNDELIAPSSITVTIGVSSNTTNPSGIIIGGFQDERRDLTNVNGYRHRQEFFEHYLPSGSYNGFITLSGFKKILSLSGNYYNDSYDYLTKDLIGNVGLFVKNPYSPNYSSETKIHSVKLNYDAWLIPETGYNATTLYISGAPIVHNDSDLFIEGEETHDNTDLFIQGLLPYSGNTTLFTMGGIEIKNSTLFMQGKIPESGNIPLFIAGQTEFDSMPLYLHNEFSSHSGDVTLFMFATSSGVYGVNGGIDMTIFADVSEFVPLYLHNEDDATNIGELPLVMYGELIGSKKHTTMYIANSGFESSKNTTMYLMGDYSIDASSNMPLFINRLTSNDAHFTTMFVKNNGAEIESTLYTKGAYISNSGITLFMPSSFTPTTNQFKMYTHGF